MKIRMKVQISGTRDGADWPPAGAVLHAGKPEAEWLIATGYAEAIEPEPDPEPIETATNEGTPERAIAPRPRRR